MYKHAIAGEALSQFATSVFQSVGVPSGQVGDAVQPLVWASLRGVDTHGVRNLKSYYVDALAQQRINAAAQFVMDHETTLSARTDGQGGLGMVAACWGMRLAIQKAANSGIGLVSMRNSNHLGAAGFYSQMAVEHDLIGLCMSGHLYADGNESGMPPVFSLQPMFGTNPLSIAFPCGDEPPYVLDMSTTVVPVNRVEMMQAAGQSIPRGWCLDADGEPTTDPAAARIYLPLGGTRDLGAHKGFGLAMLVEIVTAVLSAGWSETGEPPRFAQDAIAHFFGAIRIDLFRELTEFKSGMDAMIRSLHAAPPAPGHDRVYVPGEIEHEMEQERRRNGIPLTDTEVRDLRDLSASYDVPLHLLDGPSH